MVIDQTKEIICTNKIRFLSGDYMTVKEWAKEYPEIATALFNCSVDELDSILEEKPVNTSDSCYLTKAEVDSLIEALG